MAQGNSGSFTLSGSQNFAVIINWSETYNESANTHVVSITSCQLVSYNWYGFTYYPNGTLSINGSTVVTFNSQTGTHNCTIQTQSAGYPIIPASGSSYPAAPWSSGTIAGNADGTKTVNIAANFQCFTWMARAAADGVSAAVRTSRSARSRAHPVSPCPPPRWAVRTTSRSPGRPHLLRIR